MNVKTTAQCFALITCHNIHKSSTRCGLSTSLSLYPGSSTVRAVLKPLHLRLFRSLKMRCAAALEHDESTRKKMPHIFQELLFTPVRVSASIGIVYALLRSFNLCSRGLKRWLEKESRHDPLRTSDEQCWLLIQGLNLLRFISRTL